MENRIGWLGSPSSGEQEVDETLVSVDTYTGEEVRLTPDQLAVVKAYEQTQQNSIADLMTWLGVETVEEAEAFLVNESTLNS